MSKYEVILESLYDTSNHYNDNAKNELIDKYRKLLNHLDLVSSFCRKLAFKLIDEGQTDLAHKLMIAGQTHDLSKFYGEEWEYLCNYDNIEKDCPELKVAITNHVYNNSHHPEFWEFKGGIHAMQDAELCELLCDWMARGEEFNKPLKQFLQEKAFAKYNFDEQSAVFQRMNYFYRLLTGRNL